MSLKLRPVSFREACAFVHREHRHHLPPIGHKFSIGLESGGRLVGVAIVGRPVSRQLDDGWTAEVTRLCTDGTKNAASKLYAACWRACRAMGYEHLITYTLDSEPGTSLRAAGWVELYTTRGGSWSRPSRQRLDKAPVNPKVCWGKLA